MNNPHCYVSYMANDRDLKGILVINYLLINKFKSKYKYYCICIENVSDHCINILKDNSVNIIKFRLHNNVRRL